MLHKRYQTININNFIDFPRWESLSVHISSSLRWQLKILKNAVLDWIY